MQGGSAPEAQGLIPRSVAQILATARRLSEGAGWAYSLEASFLEIYNEAVRDLLRVPKPGGPPEPSSLPIVNSAPPPGTTAAAAASSSAASDGSGGEPAANAGVEVPGLTRVPVEDEAAVAVLLARAAKRRSVATTAMNEVSSRSHSVFTLYIRGVHAGKGIALGGTLNLVDLAGSERLDRSKAEGERKKEAAAINKSLSCLADVFAALARKAPHVPFRNSKLTHLLSPCFRGDGKTLMLVNLSPTPASASESLCSLRFAATVAQVELGPAAKKVCALPDEEAAVAGGSGSGDSQQQHETRAGSSAAATGGARGGRAPASAAAAPAAALPAKPRSLAAIASSSSSSASATISSMRALPIAADYGAARSRSGVGGGAATAAACDDGAALDDATADGSPGGGMLPDEEDGGRAVDGSALGADGDDAADDDGGGLATEEPVPEQQQ